MDIIKAKLREASLFQKWIQLLYTPIDSITLGLIRICLASALFYQQLENIFSDRCYRDYILPQYQLNYPYLSWVKPFPETTMLLIQFIFLASTIGLIINYRYRLSTLLTWGIYTYFFLINAIYYNNHYYLISLLLLLFALSPNPNKYHFKFPFWPLFLIRSLLILMYTYAGIAKLTNPDWLEGYQMSIWLNKLTTHSLLNCLSPSLLASLLSWSGLLFDLCISPLLLWEKTRKLAFIMVITFHITNAYILFSQFTGPTIGIFPFVAASSTVLAFSNPGSVRKKIASFIDTLLSEPSASQSNWATWGALAALILIPLMLFTLPLSDIRNGFCLPATWTSDGHLTEIKQESSQENQKSDIYFALSIFQFNALRTPPQLTKILKLWKSQHPKQSYGQTKIIIDDTMQEIPLEIRKEIK